MKPGEDKWSVDIEVASFPKFFSGFLSQLITTEEDLKKPVGELIIRWFDDVISKDKDSPYKTRTGSIADIKCNTHYKKLVSFTVQLRDHNLAK